MCRVFTVHRPCNSPGNRPRVVDHTQVKYLALEGIASVKQSVADWEMEWVVELGVGGWES